MTQSVTQVDKATQKMLPTPIIGNPPMVTPKVRTPRSNSWKAIMSYADRTLRLAAATNDQTTNDTEFHT